MGLGYKVLEVQGLSLGAYGSQRGLGCRPSSLVLSKLRSISEAEEFSVGMDHGNV